MVHHIHPTRNICDGFAAYGGIRKNRAASIATTGEQNWERQSSKGCLVQCSHKIVWPLLIASINICLPLEHRYRKGSISGNSGVFDGEPCLWPQTFMYSFKRNAQAEEERLIKPIQRKNVSNFAQENSKKRRPIAKGKPAAESLRDIFIRILVILSNSTTFNLRHVMTFPITEYRLCIIHSDVSGLKTEKDNLLNKLEELQDGSSKRPSLTSGGAVTADTICCANCVEPSRPRQWVPIYRFWACRSCRPAGWLALLLT